MNLPNILTMFRLGLIPVYFLVFFSDLTYNMELALLVIVLAGLTDIVDGYLARKYGLITELGSMLDPLADKLMMLSVVLSFVIDDRVSWLMAGLLIVRDLGMILASVVYVTQGKKTVPATIWGKMNTVLYYLALVALMFRWPNAEAYLWGVIILSFLISFHYMRRFRAMNI
ncbi:CDP-diacylglycerol--glycerol-3-phosphate 3-phosphatidyltransferase [Tumebacillus algifaecis]|uniref:CDP-diacylglycerol--glycerol-3-phosphate 3-phosphatidyltransferase n=1 Tax=Tumebacillus algifaecis TaxID=1214604 RepID=A0A223CXD2_9BACL|nr:CDP-diacylglycerol--glycerol-3-phosphate 3-phosphatidyltransferase [Tumebacillus algifaecis]ASS73875.1 CDP-diacylglycerol--glycerol-3-phosphate 3-phosphatidyltransferase [Tumebacillus algifaecis]